MELMRRELRPDYLLAENIRSLLNGRGLTETSLAVWCGHRPAWISKILSNERGVKIADLGKIADFFGLTTSELFSPGISLLTERRKSQRRTCHERRSHEDRRRGERHPVHPEVNPFKLRGIPREVPRLTSGQIDGDGH
jgi:transcriptional regulator with XRE-family HTH domain